MTQLQVGSRVFFEGLYYSVKTIEGGRVSFVSDLVVSESDKRPRFQTLAALTDLRWSDELAAFYLWGRLLCKGRGGVGDDQRAIVAELRDRGVLPSRGTRRQGQAPAGGEHVNLCCALFQGGVDWKWELESLRRGGKLSDRAELVVAVYKERFKQKLTAGYADPDADDSWAAD